MSSNATHTDGKNSVTRDAKLGHLTNGVVTAVGLAVVSWLGDLDFSTFPTAIATLAPVAVGLASGWITNYLARRTTR